MSLNVIEAATNIAASNSLFPAIATLSNGDYVVATIPFTSDFNLDEVIVTQVFDSQGNPVATGTVSQPFFTPGIVSLGGLSGGGFVLGWDSDASPAYNIGSGIYTVSGSAVTAQSYASVAYTVANNVAPAVMPLASGGYALSWLSSDVISATFDAQGTELTAPVDVSNAPASPVAGAAQAGGGRASRI